MRGYDGRRARDASATTPSSVCTRCLRAARLEVGRRRPPVAVAGPDGVEDLAVQAADDALVAILTKLHTYRGDSRFTTWAYKFALLEAAAKLRRRPWHGRELPLEADGWAKLLDDTGASFLCSRGSL